MKPTKFPAKKIEARKAKEEGGEKACVTFKPKNYFKTGLQCTALHNQSHV